MNRFPFVLLAGIAVSTAVYGQAKAQLVLDHFEGVVRTRCGGNGEFVETPFSQPQSKITRSITCQDRLAAGVSATTTMELEFTAVPATLPGSFVSNGGQVSGTFTPDAPVVTSAASKVVLTVPRADGHLAALGDGGSECTTSSDNNFSSSFMGTRTLNLTNTCTRIISIRNISDLQTSSVRIIGGGNPFSPRALTGSSDLPHPLLFIQIDAIYKMELLPQEDLMITHIHAVQAVQTPYDEVSLVGGKKTAARIFIKSVGATAKPAAGISARLKCTGFLGAQFQASAATPSITAGVIAAPPAPDAPPELGDPSVDIVVPARCAETGTSTLEAEIVLPGGATDPNLANNKLTKNVTFKTPSHTKEQPFRVAYVRIPFQQPPLLTPLLADATHISQANVLLGQLYPIPDDAVRYFPLTIDLPPWIGSVSTSVEWKGLLSYFAKAMLLADPTPGDDFDQVIGVIPAAVDVYASGRADSKWGGGAGAASIIVDYGDEYAYDITAAHEIGHNLGLRHTNKRDEFFDCPRLARDPYSAWPYPDPAIHTYAYDQSDMTVVPPHRFDLMSYCPDPELWISAHSSESLFINQVKATGGLPHKLTFRAAQSESAAPGTRSATPQDLWLLSGAVKADGSSGTLAAVVRVTANRVPQETDPSGTHCIRFSLPGNATSNFCFTPSFTTEDGEDLDTASFNLLIPALPTATRAALMLSTNELAAITAAGALTVTITAPQAGQQWNGGTQTIAWTSNGGANARYAVQYSSDGGTGWLPLGTDLTATSLSFDSGKIQGSTNVRFRVLAGSGLSTGSAEVGPIQVLQNPRLQVAAGTVELHNAVATQGVDREIALSNTGTGPLKITAVVASSDQFQIISPQAPTTIMAGSTVPLVLRFVPGTTGDVNGNVRIDSNDTTTPSITIPLHGKGVAAPTAEIGVTPTSLAFGTVQQGKGATLAANVANYGPAPLNVTSYSVSGTGFSLPAPSSSFTLKVNESRTIPVRFLPTANGAANGTLNVASNDPVTPSLAIALTGTGSAPTAGITPPAISAGGVVNAASFTPALARGALSSIFGTNLTNGTEAITAATWPRLAQGTKVLVAGIEAPLFYLSPGLINYQIPYEVPLGPVQVAVIRDGYESNTQTVTIAESGIGVFGYPRTASDYDPIVIHLDATLVTPQNPAKAGEFLLVFLTGVGPIDGYPRSGLPVALSPLPATLTSAQVTLAGAPVQALYLGMTPGFIGLAQLNIKMPDTLPAGNKLALKVQEGASSHTVNLYVQ